MSGTRPLDHEELRDLVAVHALHALEPEDVEIVVDHLRECPRCRAELEEHREVAAVLANSGASAPEGIWDRIAGELDGRVEPPPLRLVVSDDDLAGRERRQRRTVVRRAMGAVASVAAVALLGVLLSDTASQRADLRDLREERAVAGEAASALGDPGARIVDLSDTEGALGEPGALVGRAVVGPDGDGYLLGEGLPALTDGIYQLWGLNGGDVISLGSLGTDPDVASFRTDHAISGLMVTQETELVEQSSNPAVASGSF